MVDFYIPEYNSKEGFKVLKWQPRSGSERTIQCNDNGEVWDGWKIFHLGKDVFRTKQAAIEKSKEMRAKKIASLEKQIDKLKSFC